MTTALVVILIYLLPGANIMGVIRGWYLAEGQPQPVSKLAFAMICWPVIIARGISK